MADERAIMDARRQDLEVDVNYTAFVGMLAAIVCNHRDEFALMRDGGVVGFYPNAGAANRAGLERFADEIFSIQEVTDEPIDLGFWSHAVDHRITA
jgi:hypothetical protein